MGKPIESDALDRVYRILGLSGGALPKGTLLDDGNVSQVLDLNPIIRRSRTPAATSGWFVGILNTIHAAAGRIATSINPYTTGDNVEPYPSPVPRGFDVWVLGASIIRLSGAGDLDGAVLQLDPSPSQQGWGVDNTGAAVVQTLAIPIARFGPLDTSIASELAFAFNPEGGQSMIKVMTRVPRGATLRVATDATAAATFQTQLICGLFVESLGQDVAQ